MFKTWLAAISITSLAWLAFFGNLLDPTPSTTTMVALGVCWGSFSLLLVLRMASFLPWLARIVKANAPPPTDQLPHLNHKSPGLTDRDQDSDHSPTIFKSRQ